MPKLYKLILLLFIPVLLSAQKTTKKELLEKVITQAGTYNDLVGIIDIVKENPSVYKFIPSIHPIAAKNKPRLSSPFGTRFHPIDKKYKLHAGQDFVADFATTIHATADGKILFSGKKGGYGKCVIIEHQYGFKTIYAHLTAYYTVTGKNVKKGEIIGFLGNTGKSTGAHLHYEVIKNNIHINPIDFLSL